MDDQNNPGGNAPSEPATPPAEPTATAPSTPQPEEHCVTCGGSASGGVCTACGQGEISCTCQTGAPTGNQGGPTEGGPTSPPVGEPGPGAPAV